MRLKYYLNEKVTKSELNQIFKDDSILIGAEFEFFIPKIADRYVYTREVDGYTYDDIREDLNNYIKELDDWAYNYNTDMDELQKQLKKYQDELEPMKDYDTDVFGKDISKEREEVEEKIQEIEESMESLLADSDPPEVPRSVIVFGTEMGQEWIREFHPIYYLESPATAIIDLQDLYPPEDDHDQEMDKEAFFEEVGDEILDSIDEIEDIKIDQSPSIGHSWWGVLEDESTPMAEGGVELVSPPLPITEFLKVVPKVLDFIDKDGHTSSKTGLHVSISIQGIDLKKNLDSIKLLLFHDEELVYRHFKDREGNIHASSVKGKLKNPEYKFDDLYKLIETGKLDKKIRGGKMYGINFDKLEKNYLEFRYMGAADYEDKWDSIKTLVGNHAYNIKLACDPDFKRREYTIKLTRLINRFQETNAWKYISVVYNMYMMDLIKEKFSNNGFANQEYRKFQEVIDSTLKALGDNISVNDIVKNFKSLDIPNSKMIEYINDAIRRMMVSGDYQWFVGREEGEEVMAWIANKLEEHRENLSPKKLRLEIFRRFPSKFDRS